MFDVFGAEMPLAVRFFLAFLIVLGLIGATAWAVRRFGGGRLSSTTRGRQPRLAVIDYASVDARRRLILVRRDNVEHLLMIGGPTDVVVEPNIVRATPAARDVPSARPPVAADALPRVIPLPEAPSNGSWPLQPEPAGPPLPPAPPRRAPRVEPIQEEPRNFPPPPPLPEAPPRPQREALAALAEDLAAGPVPPLLPRNRPAGPVRPQPNEQRAEARSEPRLPAPSADPEAPSAVDQNLAEMAQRLEAALRKPKSTEEPESPRRIRPTQSICTGSGNIIWTRLAQRAVDSWLGDDLGTAHPCPLPAVELPEVIETARQCSSRLTAKRSVRIITLSAEEPQISGPVDPCD